MFYLFEYFFAHENKKRLPLEVTYNWPKNQPQNQPKSQLLFHKNCSLDNLCVMTLLSCVYLCTEYLNKFVVICKNMLILRYATRKYSGTSFSTSFASVLTFMHILPNNCNKIIFKSLYDPLLF